MTAKHHKKGSPLPPLKPGVLRLYSMRYCPFAERARLVLAHKKIPHETVNVNLKDKPEWFLAKNPQGTVPVLEIDGKIVYESTATSEWLDDVYPQNHLQPTDPYRKAWDRIHFEYFSKVMGTFGALGQAKEASEKAKLAQDAAKHWKCYDDALAQRGGPFFGGDKPAMLDFFIWPFMWRGQGQLAGSDLSLTNTAKIPNLSKWYQAMQQLPAVKETLVDGKLFEHFSKTMAAGNPDYDYMIED